MPYPKKSKNKNAQQVEARASGDWTPLVPLNPRQSEYIQAIKSDPVVLCIGILGSSKTYIPSIMAADALRAKEVERIIVARPCEGKSKSAGFFKGDKNEKLEGWCAPVTETLKKRLGVGHYEAYLANGRIELLALEQVKGRSWDNAFVIVDEAEDLDAAVAKSLVTRQGQNTTMVIAGDLAQKDIKHHSGLDTLLAVSEYTNLRMSLIVFDDWDEHCVRSDEAREWGRGFEAYEAFHKGT
jgi:phosphate starvation-inducible PhoH-like protein